MNQEDSWPARSSRSNEGCLVRDLRVLRSLAFERTPGSRFYLTLLNARPGQIGLDVEAPLVGKALVFVARLRGEVQFMLRRGPEDELMTLSPPAGTPVCLTGPGGECLQMAVVHATARDLGIRFTVPAVGRATVTFRMRHDRARLVIVADRDIRILPSPGDWN